MRWGSVHDSVGSKCGAKRTWPLGSITAIFYRVNILVFILFLIFSCKRYQWGIINNFPPVFQGGLYAGALSRLQSLVARWYAISWTYINRLLFIIPWSNSTDEVGASSNASDLYLGGFPIWIWSVTLTGLVDSLPPSPLRYMLGQYLK